MLIDFGRASNINDNIDDTYFNTTEKNKLKRKKDTFFNELFSMANHEAAKCHYILEVLDYIANLDNKINQQIFRYSTSSAYQMDWYENYKTLVNHDNSICIETFDKLYAITATEGSRIARRTLEQASILNFEDAARPDDFVVPFPSVPPSASVPKECDDTTGWGCNIMGGRKHRKSRKYPRKYPRR